MSDERAQGDNEIIAFKVINSDTEIPVSRFCFLFILYAKAQVSEVAFHLSACPLLLCCILLIFRIGAIMLVNRIEGRKSKN